MSTTTFPNGQTLTSTALTVQQINAVIQPLTCGALGVNPPDYAQVRIDWQSQGQPFIDLPNKDICFLSCIPQDVEYSRVRDQALSGTGPVTETWTYTRGWRVAWTLYGPNSTDRARALHSAMVFMDYFATQLELSNLYVVPDTAEPVRVPEQFNAQWYERVDFHVLMYEAITETIQDTVVTSVETIVNTNVGQVADIVVTK